MAGPNLEVLKFGIYLFVPIWALVRFGDPEWYRHNVLPYKDRLFPPDERVQKEIPTERTAIIAELEKFKEERREKRAERERSSQP